MDNQGKARGASDRIGQSPLKVMTAGHRPPRVNGPGRNIQNGQKKSGKFTRKFSRTPGKVGSGATKNLRRPEPRGNTVD